MRRATNNPYPTAGFDFRLERRGLVPRSTDRIKLPEGAKEHLGALALDIFTHASNHGQVFQEALLAVYLSGLNHGAVCAAAELEEKLEAAARILHKAGEQFTANANQDWAQRCFNAHDAALGTSRERA